MNANENEKEYMALRIKALENELQLKQQLINDLKNKLKTKLGT